MYELKLLSWNVNGIRAAYKKGFLKWLYTEMPDILCLQEVRARTSQLRADLRYPNDYYVYWNSGKTAGYSGTALFSRIPPNVVTFGLGVETFDREGRVIIAEYPDFVLINSYFPNGNWGSQRLEFKLNFYDAFLDKCQKILEKRQAVLFCGDLNTAHTEIDLANPSANRIKSGFLRVERDKIDKLVETGFIDTFRSLYPDQQAQYTWWANTNNARSRNLGWRYDYFFASEETIQRVVDAVILQDVELSDHCPVGIRFLSNMSWLITHQVPHKQMRLDL